MTFFSATRTKRNIAFVVLLVWMFALASGVANACLSELLEGHSSALPAAVPKTSQAPAEGVGHRQAAASHDGDSDTSKEACLKACDDGTRTMPRAQCSVDQTDPGPAPLVAILWRAALPVVLAARRIDDVQVHIVGPPFRVRYSRLAL